MLNTVRLDTVYQSLSEGVYRTNLRYVKLDYLG